MYVPFHSIAGQKARLVWQIIGKNGPISNPAGITYLPPEALKFLPAGAPMPIPLIPLITAFGATASAAGIWHINQRMDGVHRVVSANRALTEAYGFAALAASMENRRQLAALHRTITVQGGRSRLDAARRDLRQSLDYFLREEVTIVDGQLYRRTDVRSLADAVDALGAYVCTWIHENTALIQHGAFESFHLAGDIWHRLHRLRDKLCVEVPSLRLDAATSPTNGQLLLDLARMHGSLRCHVYLLDASADC